MAVIYIATNKINGKRYIGVSTTQTMRARMTQHKSDALSRKRKSRFHDAIRKYGFQAFDWMEIAHFESAHEAFMAEIKLIADIKPEYNISAGGEGRRSPLSEEAKQKLRGNKNASGNKSSRDRVITVEFRKKLSDSLKNSPNIKRRPVICLDTGVIYKSLVDAGNAHGIDWTAIQKVCSGKKYNKTARGLRFSYYIGPMEVAV